MDQDTLLQCRVFSLPKILRKHHVVRVSVYTFTYFFLLSSSRDSVHVYSQPAKFRFINLTSPLPTLELTRIYTPPKITKTLECTRKAKLARVVLGLRN